MSIVESAVGTELDLSLLLGDWRNTNARGTIARIVIAPIGPMGPIGPIGPITVHCDWGAVPAPVFAFEFDNRQAGAFLAVFDFGDREVRMQANVKLGVLVVVTLNRFRDESGRSNYFEREFFYRVPA